MHRTWALALLTATAGFAEEIAGKIAAVDLAARTITIKADGKERKFPVHREVTVTVVRGSLDKKGKKVERIETLASGLAGLKVGAEATVLTETQNAREVATSVKTTAAAGDEKADRQAARKNKKSKK